jgi:hypothetical protein
MTRPGDHVFVLFGATGDLARRKLLPGLFNLARAGLLPEGYRIVGSAPAQFALTADASRTHAHDAVATFGLSEPSGQAWESFEASLSFGAADPADPEPLLAAVRAAEQSWEPHPSRSATRSGNSFVSASRSRVFEPLHASEEPSGLEGSGTPSPLAETISEALGKVTVAVATEAVPTDPATEAVAARAPKTPRTTPPPRPGGRSSPRPFPHRAHRHRRHPRAATQEERAAARRLRVEVCDVPGLPGGCGGLEADAAGVQAGLADGKYWRGRARDHRRNPRCQVRNLWLFLWGSSSRPCRQVRGRSSVSARPRSCVG